MTRYFVLDDATARDYLNRSADDETPLPAGKQVGSGPMMDLQPIARLVAQMAELRTTPRYREPLHLRDPRGGRFETEAAGLVHAALAGLDSRILGDPGFWVWLSVARFSALIDWRYRATENHALPRNYGVGSPKEGFLFRLWLRGDYLYDPTAADPYAYARLGDQDLWRSHIFRQEFPKPIAAALLHLQEGQLAAPKLKGLEIRALAKELHRVGATVLYETLSEAQAAALVVSLAERIETRDDASSGGES